MAGTVSTRAIDVKLTAETTLDGRRMRALELFVKACSELDPHHMPGAKTLEAIREAMHLVVSEEPRDRDPVRIRVNVPTVGFVDTSELCKRVREAVQKQVSELAKELREPQPAAVAKSLTTYVHAPTSTDGTSVGPQSPWHATTTTGSGSWSGSSTHGYYVAAHDPHAYGK